MSARGRLALVLVLVLAGALFCGSAFGAATIAILNNDPAGVGFNDPTVVAPVGGNAGTTLGQQRLIAFQAAADKWGATLTSSVTIVVRAQWTALSCNSGSAVLGSAGAVTIWRDFFGVPVAAHWYPAALASKILGSDVDPPTPDINANFNVNLGNPGCLDGVFFYLGLDNAHGGNIDLVTVLEHEFGHGLGFQTFTSGSTGAQASGFPSIWDDFLLDTTTGLTWTQMNAPQRVTSALNSRRLVWNGANVTAALPAILQAGTPVLTVTAPASVAGTYSVGAAAFGAALASPGLTGEVMPIVDTAPNLGLACSALSALNAAAVSGKIALLDRGICAFTVKVKAAQDAGALGVLVADNVTSSPPSGLSGTDPTITIPSVRIALPDGNALKGALATRSRLHSGMSANLGLNLAIRSGGDALGRALMYTPNPFQGGSSVSHWDTIAFPNQLMEPAINGDLTHDVAPPNDLTFPLLKDIGWN
ncbi:MAG: peptidase [Thermoanaerobaculia bacterium]|nr:peptidase [Thermoanaerobaculia bacterium]